MVVVCDALTSLVFVVVVVVTVVVVVASVVVVAVVVIVFVDVVVAGFVDFFIVAVDDILSNSNAIFVAVFHVTMTFITMTTVITTFARSSGHVHTPKIVALFCIVVVAAIVFLCVFVVVAVIFIVIVIVIVIDVVVFFGFQTRRYDA